MPEVPKNPEARNNREGNPLPELTLERVNILLQKVESCLNKLSLPIQQENIEEYSMLNSSDFFLRMFRDYIGNVTAYPPPDGRALEILTQLSSEQGPYWDVLNGNYEKREQMQEPETLASPESDLAEEIAGIQDVYELFEIFNRDEQDQKIARMLGDVIKTVDSIEKFGSWEKPHQYLDAIIRALPEENGLRAKVIELVNQRFADEILKMKGDEQPSELPSELEPDIENKTDAVNPEITRGLSALGMTKEQLEEVPGFADIKDSEGQTIFLLRNLAQIKRRVIAAEAREQTESEIRQTKNGIARALKRTFSNGKVNKKEQALSREAFDFEKYKDEVANVIEIVKSVGDIASYEGDEGKMRLYIRYTEDVSFNTAASEYTEVPPEYKWKDYSSKEKKIFQERKKTYLRERENLLNASGSSAKEAMLQLNDVDLKIKINQSLLENPNAELELRRLAEVKGWDMRNEAAKAQLGIEGRSSLIGGVIQGAGQLGLRMGARAGAKSLLAGCIGIVSAPLSAAIVGAGFGAFRGGKKAHERLGKEEELIRMGSEEKTTTNKKLKRLIEEKARYVKREVEISRDWHPINEVDQAEKEGELARIKGRIEEIQSEINSVREKSTDQNFVKADDLSEKIGRLNRLAEMSYISWCNEPGNANRSLDEYHKKHKECVEALEVRLEYAQRKLTEGRISFGAEKEAIGNKFNFIKVLSKATACLATDTYFYDEDSQQEIVGKKGSTRRGRLAGIIGLAEERIKNNQRWYVGKQAALGAVTGGLVSGLVSGAIQEYSGLFSSHMAGDIHDHAREVASKSGYVAGKDFENTVTEGVKNQVAHNHAEHLINSSSQAAASPTPDSSPIQAPGVHHSDFHIDNSPLRRLLVTDHPASAAVPQHAASVKPPAGLKVEIPAAAAPKPEVPVAVIEKPFTFVLKNEHQSREYALVQYFKSKGLSSHEAGIKAHRTLKELFGPKGERTLTPVHAHDNVLISEKDGKISISLVPKAHVVDTPPQTEVVETILIKDHQIDQLTHHEIHTDSAERAVTRTLHENADKYGYNGDMQDAHALHDWTSGMTREVLKQNPDIAHAITHDGNALQLHRTPTGGWFAEVKKSMADVHQNAQTTTAPVAAAAPASADHVASTADVAQNTATTVAHEMQTPPEVTQLLSSYEVKAPTNLPTILEKILEKDPRFMSLSADAKDRALYDLFINEYVKEGASSYKDIGITSGNPFDIASGTLSLDSNFLENSDVVSSIIKEATDPAHVDSLKDGLGLREHLSDLANALKGLNAKDVDAKAIAEKLKELREAK